MKAMACVLLCLLFLPGAAQAAQLPQELAGTATDQVARLLEGGEDLSGVDGFLQGAGQIWRDAAEELPQFLRGSLKSMVLLLLIVLCCGFCEGAFQAVEEKKIPNYTRMAGALSITLLTGGSLNAFIGTGMETLEQLHDFSKLLLPTLAAATAAAGGVSSAGVKQVTTVFFIDLLLSLVSRLLSPLLYLYVGVLAAGAVLEGGQLRGLAELIKKIVTWGISGILLLFLAYLTVTGVISGSADALSVRAVKMTISGMLPVVGGLVSDASETVLVGAGLLRNSIGVFGMLMVLSICLLPFLKLGLQYLLYKCAAFAATTAGDTPLVRLIDGFAGAFGLMLGMTGSSALLLFISLISSVRTVVS